MCSENLQADMTTSVRVSDASKIRSPQSSGSAISGAPAPGSAAYADGQPEGATGWSTKPAPTSYCILNNGHVLLLSSDVEQPAAPQNVRDFLEPATNHLDPIMEAKGEDTLEAGSYLQATESPTSRPGKISSATDHHYWRRTSSIEHQVDPDELALICEEDVSDIEN